MNRCVIIVVGMLCFGCNLCSAQFVIMQGSAIQIPGEIVYNDGTTARANFEVVVVLHGFSVEYMQNKVRYFDENGKRHKLRPSEAKEIRFQWREQEVRMITRRAVHHTNKLRFMHLIIDGKVRLYEYIKTYRYSGRQGMSYARIRTAVYWYLERDEDGTVITPHSLGFRHQMKNFFTGCETLTERLDAKVYKLREVPAIVTFYNQDCQK
ncbi:MAG: hypothetical protein WDO14_13015 [Bacteroidota bacterium]